MAKKRTKTSKTSKSKSASRSSSKKPAAKKSQKKSGEEKLIEKLRHFIRTEGAKYLADPNITSLGIGYKITDGKRTDDLCIQFTVKDKPEVEGTLPEGIDTSPIPESLEIDGQEIPTDVLQRDYKLSYELLEVQVAEALSDRKLRRDPLVPGISVAHFEETAGTLGMIVYDLATGAPCMLSNWHVLHGALGDIGDKVVQPGPFDNNRIEENVAGVLLRSHLGPAGDCAIARIEGRTFETEILSLGVTPARVARVDLDDRVIKSGRTTDVTQGVVRRIDVMASIAYPGLGEVAIGAFEIEPLPGAPPSFEVSMGGDSGSVWLIADDEGDATEILAGLHFAGESSSSVDEHALACYAHSIIQKLQISLTPIAPEAVRDLGYNPGFLSERVEVPKLNRQDQRDAVEVDGSHLIPYTHFSVCQSQSRKLPRFVAWNIDGAQLKSVSRRGTRFRLDPRVPEEFQAGNDLYANNPLDRGHIARRADLTWGSLTEAKRANSDSFFFTNITPQHEAFNQSSKSGLWGRLENAILEEVEVEDLRVSVMAGPVFAEDDDEIRNVKIPKSYWKLIAYQDDEDDQFKVRAYILTQKDLIRNLEALDLDPFRLYQVSLSVLRSQTNLNFNHLADFDTFSTTPQAEALGIEAREILTQADVVK